MKLLVVGVIIGAVIVGIGALILHTTVGTADAGSPGVENAAVKLDVLAHELAMTGLRVSQLKIDAGDPRMYAFDLHVPDEWDGAVRGYFKSLRVLAAARARGELSDNYAAVTIVYPDGTRVPEAGEIPSLDLAEWAAGRTGSVEETRAVLVPRIRDILGDFELQTASVEPNVDGIAQVLLLDVVLSADQTGQQLGQAMEKVWAEVRRLNAKGPAVGAGYLRAFDAAGHQLVTEVYDFMLNGGMVHSDIDYPPK